MGGITQSDHYCYTNNVTRVAGPITPFWTFLLTLRLLLVSYSYMDEVVALANLQDSSRSRERALRGQDDVE